MAIAVGRAIKTDADSNAILARAYVLRVLQAKKLVPDGFGEELLIRAASIRIRSVPMNQSDLTTLAALFQSACQFGPVFYASAHL